ncbi:unnamed protein product [Diatraea saccharalis]|uniref:Uncharacterized protein n=1 Tax=Diatraea saccharalis TaxID=40085 RepID=A0A9N9R226_9NEOP|nr:unnamed protein product [Diatraea saccharalis]
MPFYFLRKAFNFSFRFSFCVCLKVDAGSAKNDKNVEVYLPPLKFGDQRYFAPVIDRETLLTEYIVDLIWSSVVNYIPVSSLDGVFDIPQPVMDVRHQDTVIYFVKEAILNKIKEDIEPEPEPEEIKFRERRETKLGRDKEKEKEKEKKKPELPKAKFEIKLSGDSILAGEEVHSSAPENIKNIKKEIKFNDHHAVPLNPDTLSKITATLLDTPFEVQLRGIRLSEPQKDSARFFGYKKGDQNFGISSSKLDNEDTDILIAVTKIDAHTMAKNMSQLIRGEYSLFPPNVSVEELGREAVCNNDINHIKRPMRPHLVIPTHVVLEAQMTLEVSMGLVGCKAKKLTECFARLYCLVKQSATIMRILKKITEINDAILQSDSNDELLTGFALDVGNVVLLYVEGPSTGEILKIWEMTEDFYPDLKPVFSSSNRYFNRIYPLLSKVPFNVLKMYVPLSVILACPPIYALPALPFPTKSAVLKLGRLIAGKLRVAPLTSDMPSVAELKSLRLELCVAPKPVAASQTDGIISKGDFFYYFSLSISYHERKFNLA